MSKVVFVSIIAVIVSLFSTALAVVDSYVQTLFADAAAQMSELTQSYQTLVANAPFLAELLPVVGGFVGLLLGLWLLWMLVCPAFRR